ncbi:MAG: flagellar brake protein [Bacillota bacterium]
MLSDMLKADMRPKIYVYRENSEEKYISYINRIEKNKIYINTPFRWHSVETIRLRSGDRIRVSLPTREHLYEFKSRVVEVDDLNKNIGISFPGQLSSADVRNFVRVNKIMTVQYALLPESGEKLTFRQADTLNISAGGMKLAMPEHMKRGKPLVLQFILPVNNKYVKIKVLSTVTRSVPVASSETANMFHVGVKFDSLKKSDHEFIYQYVMKILMRARSVDPDSGTLVKKLIKED